MGTGWRSDVAAGGALGTVLSWLGLGLGLGLTLGLGLGIGLTLTRNPNPNPNQVLRRPARLLAEVSHDLVVQHHEG